MDQDGHGMPFSTDDTGSNVIEGRGHTTLRDVSTAKVLTKCKLEYYKILECTPGLAEKDGIEDLHLNWKPGGDLL